MRVTYPLATANAQVWTAYNVTALPTTYFVSGHSTVLGEDFGGMTRTSLLGLIRQLFGERQEDYREASLAITEVAQAS